MSGSAASYQVNVIGHNHPAKQLEPFFFLAVRQAFDYDIGINSPCKYISPTANCKCEKINAFLVLYAICKCQIIATLMRSQYR